MAALVVVASTIPLTAWMREARWRSDRTPLSAAAIIFFGVRWSYLRGTGPCATPP